MGGCACGEDSKHQLENPQKLVFNPSCSAAAAALCECSKDKELDMDSKMAEGGPCDEATAGGITMMMKMMKEETVQPPTSDNIAVRGSIALTGNIRTSMMQMYQDKRGALIGDDDASKQRAKLDVLAAGHAKKGGLPILIDDDPQLLLKPLQEMELSCYIRLWGSLENGNSASSSDPVCRFVPKFHGVTQDVDEEGATNDYISLDNALYGYDGRPKVMDVKLGIRTFCEDECGNNTLRPDLYKKFLKSYPEQISDPLIITDEERAAEGMTKHRYMLLRDNNTTIGKLGFRIDGVGGFEVVPEKELEKRYVGSTNATGSRASFLRFTKEACPQPLVAAEAMLTRLRAFRAALAESAFVRQHEFIGSSLLLVISASSVASFRWIDFGKTGILPDGVQITHTSPWNLGNHEDGLLTGVDNMVEIWAGVVEDCRSESGAG